MLLPEIKMEQDSADSPTNNNLPESSGLDDNDSMSDMTDKPESEVELKSKSYAECSSVSCSETPSASYCETTFAPSNTKKRKVEDEDDIEIETFSASHQSGKMSPENPAPELDAETEAFTRFIGFHLMKIPSRATFLAHMEIMEVLQKYLPSTELKHCHP